MIATIQIDSSKLTEQLYQLKALLEQLPKSRLEHAQGLCLAYMTNMSFDLTLGELVTTAEANGGLKIVQAFGLGVEFENLVAALGAGNA